jgi:hypothetical protein
MNRLLRIPKPLAAPFAVAAVALTLSACGGDEEPVTHGHSEAVYVEAGHLYYQVQISRELNPFAVDDAEYLQGVPDPVESLGREDEWFGVWLRAQNTTDEDQEAASEFKVVDAEGNEYEPIELGDENVFGYQPRTVEKKTGNGQPLLPNPDAAAGSGPIQGSMLLFRVPYSIYSNQPVELEIVPPEGGDPSTITLDM